MGSGLDILLTWFIHEFLGQRVIHKCKVAHIRIDIRIFDYEIEGYE